MTVNKFGQYLYGENSSSSRSTSKKYSPLQSTSSSSQNKTEINCLGRRLTHVSKGIQKGDAVTKAQLDDISINSLIKIKELRKKIDLLEKRLTTPAVSVPQPQSPLPPPPSSPAAPSKKPTKRIAPTAAAGVPSAADVPSAKKTSSAAPSS